MSGVAKVAEELGCPFCGDAGFDLVGLKAHLLRWCEIFAVIKSPEEEQRLRVKKRAELEAALEALK